MKTRRILTTEDSRSFFSTSINTMEQAIGKGSMNLASETINLDIIAVSLLQFDNISKNVNYQIIDKNFDESFRKLLEDIKTSQHDINSERNYIRTKREKSIPFNIKIDVVSETIIDLYFIDYEMLFDTEKQLNLFGKVVGSGLSLFSGSTWYIDYDKQNGYFYSSDVGPKILGLEITDDKKYKSTDFQKVREKARIVSDFYDLSVEYEIKAYEKVRRNESDYFAGRAPTITSDDNIVWVEAYGKCILRYPDGSPRFFLAIDIYMSEIHEEKTQLELFNNLTDYGLLNSAVGIWYHQRHYLEGKYYFTNSYQKLMSNTKTYKDENISNLLDEQIELMIKDGRGYEEKLHEFRKVHNSIYTQNVDKYHIVIPQYKDENNFIWIEVRGTVIERDEEGHVLLFVGVNVDVTESYLRNQELEQLRVQNERLQIAENLAIKARDLMIWYHVVEKGKLSRYIFGNEIFESKLGVKRTSEGHIKIGDLIATLVTDDEESSKSAIEVKNFFKSIYRQKVIDMQNIVAKQRNPITGETMFIEHSIELSDYNEDGSIKLIGGVLLDITKQTLYQKQIKYLADFDMLTGVNNRNFFESYIANELPSSYTIVIFDLDGLKLINDAFGHLQGDQIIKKIANLLKYVFDESNFIARIGGDEFALICNNTDSEFFKRKHDHLKSEIMLFNETSNIEMNVSSGTVFVINNDVTFEKAFVQAENIMYRSKLSNRKSRKSKVLDSILETLNAKTEETKEHSDRLSSFAVNTMKELGMVRINEIEDMKLLAKVHDIGKITIEDSILKKPSSLSKSEFELIKKHCEAGYKVIRNITDSDEVCNGVLFHHERFDGSGYPQGLKGDAIPIFARIISVVDAFDAMTSDRVYNTRMTKDEAIKEIKLCSGSQFDPIVAKAFIDSLK